MAVGNVCCLRIVLSMWSPRRHYLTEGSMAFNRRSRRRHRRQSRAESRGQPRALRCQRVGWGWGGLFARDVRGTGPPSAGARRGAGSPPPARRRYHNRTVYRYIVSDITHRHPVRHTIAGYPEYHTRALRQTQHRRGVHRPAASPYRSAAGGRPAPDRPSPPPPPQREGCPAETRAAP